MHEPEYEVNEMRVFRMALGYALMFASVPLAGPLLRLTNDFGFRLVILTLFLAVSGLGLALVWFDSRESSN